VSVVVSDTSPLHYLVLCRVETILPALFGQVVIPPMVFHELQRSNTPPVVERLRQTNARLDPELVRAALARDQARREKR